jgi:hypothetical protein
MLDRDAVERWIHAFVRPTAPIEVTRVRPWATVLRVPVAGGAAWFKACSPVQAFEPRLSGELFARWPDRVGEVLAYDAPRAWLLLADAGLALRELGNRPEAWLDVLPLYAELQRGEAIYADDHIAHGVPSLPISTLPVRYSNLLDRDLPLEPDERGRLAAFLPRLEQLCTELCAAGLPLTVQHDDLHMGSVYERYKRLRVLDWGDSSISHPFFSLVVTFRFLEEHTGLKPHDPWFARLRDAYLEPWGTDLAQQFDLALRVGTFAHAIAWSRQREFLPPEARTPFDEWFAQVLRRALDVATSRPLLL